ncbi:MAG: transglutaminase family protein [Nitrospinales bacterium]
MKLSTKIYAAVVLTVVLCGSAAGQTKIPIEPGEQESWMGVYFRGHKLGFTHSLLRSTVDAVQMNSWMYLRMKAGGANQVTSFNQETHLTPELRLKKFSFLEEIMGHRQQIEGHPENGQLVMQVASRGYKKIKSVPFPAGSALSSTFLLNLLHEGLQVGKKGVLPIFVEPLQTFSSVEYEIINRETVNFTGRAEDAFVIRQSLGGMESTLWITPDGDVLRELSPDGFESLQEPRETAQDLPGDPMSVSSFITLSLVKTQREIVNPAFKTHGRYELSNLRFPDLIPEDHRQEVLRVTRRGDRNYSADLLVTTEPEFTTPSDRLPETSGKFLSDSSEIQANHPLIRSLSREIVGDEKDSWRAALKINDWVYKNLEKVLVDSFSALDALHDRRGECQSHTNLFTAIARAGGIPTKVINGLIYSRGFGGFVYHSWPEVFVGKWRALDPTLGQTAVDATHIKLSEGEKEGALKLMEFIGKLQIEILDD